MNMLVAGRFLVGKKLGAGEFGEVHVGTDSSNGEKVAVKLERTGADYQQLLREADIYRHTLSDGHGVAKMLWSGVEGSYNVMVMEMLGPSLEDLFVCCGRRFSLRTVLTLADQLLSRLEYVHDKGLIHRDVKPDNFVVGVGGKHDTIFVIDFGLATRYRDDATQRHIPCKTGQKLTGTARYASMNTHKGIERSRRDDLESLGYVLMYFLRGDLPWQGLKANTMKQKYARIMDCKMGTSVEQLCSGYPREFQWYLEYCRGLAFEATPNYDRLKAVFNDLLRRDNVGGDHTFDWIIKKLRMNQPHPLQHRREQPSEMEEESANGAPLGEQASNKGSDGLQQSIAACGPDDRLPGHTARGNGDAVSRGPLVERVGAGLSKGAPTTVCGAYRQPSNAVRVGELSWTGDGATQRCVEFPTALAAGAAAAATAPMAAAVLAAKTLSKELVGIAPASPSSLLFPRRPAPELWGSASLSLSTSHCKPEGDAILAVQWEDSRDEEGALQAAIAAFTPPPGRRRAPVPPPRSGRSLLYAYGVVTVDDVPDPDMKKMLFHCLANAGCRRASASGTATAIPIQKKATGNGTRHLKNVHQIESVKTKSERANCGHLRGGSPAGLRREEKMMPRQSSADELGSTMTAESVFALPPPQHTRQHQQLQQVSGIMAVLPRPPSPPQLPTVQGDHAVPATRGNDGGVNAATVRGVALSFVRMLVVSHLRGFGVGGDPAARALLDASTPTGFPEDKLTVDGVKHLVWELYASTKAVLMRELHETAVGAREEGEAAGFRQPAVLHVSLDVWVDGSGGNGGGGGRGDKHVGLRVSWMDGTLALRSALLAIKKVDGGVPLTYAEQGSGEGGRTPPVGGVADSGGWLARWTSAVLEEYRLPRERLFATVPACSGGGGGREGDSAGAGCRKEISEACVSTWRGGTCREWSLAHVLDAVLAETFGVSSSQSSEGRHHPAGQVMDLLQEVVSDLASSSSVCSCKVKFRDIRLATHSRRVGPEDAHPQGWVTTSRVMEHALAYWSDLEAHYMHHKPATPSAMVARFPLTDHRAALEEMYSVLKPVASIIERTQGRLAQKATVPSSVSTLVDLASLRLTVAEPSKRLLVHTPHSSARVNEEEWASITKVPRPMADLAAETTAVRGVLRAALDMYFFNPRYAENSLLRGVQQSGSDADAGGLDYVFEMAACMDPFLSQLSLVDSFASSQTEAARVKSIIWGKVVALAVVLAEAADSSAGVEERKRSRENCEEAKVIRKSHNGDDAGGEHQLDGFPRPQESADRRCENACSVHKRPRLSEMGPSNTNRTSIVSTPTPNAVAAAPASTGLPGNGAGSRDFDISYILESGIFSSTPGTPTTRFNTHKDQAEAELEAFKALGAKRAFGVPPLERLTSFWASDGAREFPYLSRVARVLLAFPSSSMVRESAELSGAEARLHSKAGPAGHSAEMSSPVVVDVTSGGGGGGAVGGDATPGLTDEAYTEMALFLHCSQEVIPADVPMLPREINEGSIPRRWLTAVAANGNMDR